MLTGGRRPGGSAGRVGIPGGGGGGGGSVRDGDTCSVGRFIALLYPKQHKMETQYKADSLLNTLAGWAAT